jgi:hypothetical protein
MTPDPEAAIGRWNRRIADANARLATLHARQARLDEMLLAAESASPRQRRIVDLLLECQDQIDAAVDDREFSIDQRWKLRRELMTLPRRTHCGKRSLC